MCLREGSVVRVNNTNERKSAIESREVVTRPYRVSRAVSKKMPDGMVPLRLVPEMLLKEEKKGVKGEVRRIHC